MSAFIEFYIQPKVYITVSRNVNRNGKVQTSVEEFQSTINIFLRKKIDAFSYNLLMFIEPSAIIT